MNFCHPSDSVARATRKEQKVMIGTAEKSARRLRDIGPPWPHTNLTVCLADAVGWCTYSGDSTWQVNSAAECISLSFLRKGRNGPSNSWFTVAATLTQFVDTATVPAQVLLHSFRDHRSDN